MPLSVSSSTRMEWGLRPSSMTALCTPLRMASTQQSIFGIIPPEMMPSLIRAGTSLTAEIGLMKAGEQLSAMDMMAVNPVKRILAPRFWAGIISMPILATLFCAAGVIGGYIVGVILIGVDDGAFWSQMQEGVDIWNDIGNGVVKSIVFGFAVTFMALFQGYESKPTPEGVSSATTRTVVYSSLLVLWLDFIMTALMFN